MATVTSTKRHLDVTSDTYQSNGNVIIGGDLTVNGSTTTLDTQNLIVEDKNIIIGQVSTPSDTTADGGGITLKGTTDKTIYWSNSDDEWKFNQGIEITSGIITVPGGTSTQWNTAYGWGDHSGLYAAASHTHAASDITSGTFADARIALSNITQHTDPKYLRSDANDSFSGLLTSTLTTSNALEVGGIRGLALGSQTGDYIHLYERVHIGYPGGWGASQATAPSSGLGVWGSIDLGMSGSGVLQMDGTTVLTAARVLQNVTNTNWDSAYTYSQVGHLPLSGGTIDGTLVIDTDTGAAPLTITRLGSASQSLKIWVDDSFAFFQHEQDEDTGVYGSFRFIGDAGGANPVFQWYHGATERASLDLGNGNLTLTGDLTVSGGDIILGGTGRIQGVDTVSASTDAANKAYVDAHTYSHNHDDRYYTETETNNFFSGATAITGYNKTNWDTAYNNSITSATVTGTATKTITLNQQDGGTVQASWTDDTGSNNYVTGATFNTGDGVLTLNRSGLSAVTVDLDNRYAYLDHIRSLGNQAFTGGTSGSITTAQLISEIETDGGFDSYSSVFKNSWSYAGNDNLSDAGRFTETAGTSWITWTDNSSDTTRGNITALAIAPNTGGSAGKVFIYNDQGSTYSPGWREVWTSTSDGAGSGLDADLLDGQHGSYYAAASSLSSYLPLAGGTMTGNIAMSNYNITGVNQLEINDPGEGIIWKGGSSGDITLAVVDDTSDNILRLSGTNAELQVGTNRVLTTADEGSGNGLDADTLDGQHGSYYLAWSNLTGVPSTFTPSAHTLDSHSNVTITSNSSGEILKWNGSAWVNNTLAEAGIAAASHTHDDRYYTETETNNFFSGTTAITGYNKTNWDSAYNNSITSAAVTGTTTKTLTLTQQDAGTVTATWTDETGSGVDGTGTTNYIPKWLDSDTLTDSIIYASSSYVGIGTATPGAVLNVFGGDAIINYMTVGKGYGTGLTNTSFGYQVYGGASGTNIDNTVFGYRTLYAANGALRNTAIGKEALRSLTSGDDNTAVGSQANYSLTVGGSNVAIGQTAGFSSTGGSYNVAIGRSAGYGNLSSSCIAIGYNSLQAANSASGTIAIGVQALQDQTSGAWNIGIGYSALANNTTGLANLALGYNALLDNVTGSYNLAIGTFALENCTGSYNFGIGYQSLNTVTTGTRNTGFGFRTLRYTTGSDNLAIGYQAGAAITTGTHNIAIGTSALPNFTTGSKNVGIGYFSGGSYTTNENSVYIGYNSKGSADGNTNETVIGYSATGNGSNSITLGNVANVKTIIPAGDVGIGVTSPSEKLTVSDTSGTIAGFYATSASAAVRIEAAGSIGSASLELESASTSFDNYIRSDRSVWISNLSGLGTYFKFEITSGDLHADGDVIAYSTTTSDARLKDDVKPIENAIDKVKAINGVEYTWNAGGRKGQKDLGVIAQNVEEVIPEIVREKKMDLIDGEVYKTVDYDKLTALLIEAVKEQQKQIEELKAQIDGLSK